MGESKRENTVGRAPQCEQKVGLHFKDILQDKVLTIRSRPKKMKKRSGWMGTHTNGAQKGTHRPAIIIHLGWIDGLGWLVRFDVTCTRNCNSLSIVVCSVCDVSCKLWLAGIGDNGGDVIQEAVILRDGLMTRR